MLGTLLMCACSLLLLVLRDHIGQLFSSDPAVLLLTTATVLPLAMSLIGEPDSGFQNWQCDSAGPTGWHCGALAIMLQAAVPGFQTICSEAEPDAPVAISGCVFSLHSVRSLCIGAQPRQVMLQQHVKKNDSHPIPSAGLSTMAVDGSLLPDCVQQFTCTVTSTSV